MVLLLFFPRVRCSDMAPNSRLHFGFFKFYDKRNRQTTRVKEEEIYFKIQLSVQTYELVLAIEHFIACYFHCYLFFVLPYFISLLVQHFALKLLIFLSISITRLCAPYLLFMPGI